MKRISVAILLACAASPAMAQELPVTLKDGATWTITAEHTRSGEGLGPMHNWGVATVKRLTWHAGDKNRPATLTVVPVSAKALPGSPAEIATARSLAIPATLAVDEGLVPGPVLNRDEVRAEFARIAPGAAGASAAIIDASTKAMIASELGMTSHAQALPLKIGQPISAEIDMPNPLGGPPLRGVESASLESLDRGSGRAVVMWRQVLDPAAFKASVRGMLAAMAKGKLSPEKIEEARKAFADASTESQTVCRHEVDIHTGLAVKTECDMTMATTMQGKTQRVSEHWTVTQSPPEPA